jgi:DNA polymerase-1
MRARAREREVVATAPVQDQEARKEVGVTWPVFDFGETLYVIDVNCFVHRFFYTMSGRCAYGVIEFVDRILRECEPEHFVAARDLPFPTFRDTLFPKDGDGGGYKGHREPADATILERIRWTEEMLIDVHGVPVFAVREFEADDLIATVVHQAKAAGLNVVVVGLDKDLMQLIDNTCVLWDGKRVIDAAAVQTKFGVRPDQLRDYLAIVGDGADNVPGVHGLGPAAAVEILEEFHNLNYALDVACSAHGHPFFMRRPRYREMLRAQKSKALLSQKLVTLAHEAPIKLDLQETRRSR